MCPPETLGPERREAQAGAHPRRFRADIEGLRAIAILLVVLFHAGVSTLGGGYIGVDIFFVLSGYLITGIVAEELASSGGLSLMGFYARRARRLMPASALVLLVTLLGLLLVYSPIEIHEFARSASAVALYASNLLFARRATDYLAVATEGDPFLHTWSLATEEQFYFLWPAMLLVLSIVGRRTRWHRTTVVGMTVLAVVSFIACVAVTQVRQPWAFFLSPFRFWEFAVGGIAALLPWSRLGASPKARWVGVAGLLVIVACALVFDATTTFPGALVALPVLGTVAVLVAGSTTTAASSPTTRLLSHPGLQWIGRHSYSWYLWHWPLLMLVLALRPDPPLIARLGVMVIALGLSVVTFVFLERPVRESSWLRARPGISVLGGLALAGICLIAALGVGRFATSELNTPQQRRIVVASHDVPAIYHDGCSSGWESVEPVTEGCEYGDLDAATTVALFGDSHAAHWFPALDKAGKDNGWKVVVYVKDACQSADLPASFNARLGRVYTECVEWRHRVISRLQETKPALVVMSNHVRDVEDAGDEDRLVVWERALERTTAALDGASIPTLVLTDIPAPEIDVPSCLSRAASATLLPAPDCTFLRSEAPSHGFASVDKAVMDASSLGRAADFTSVICPQERCEVDRDGQIIFSDANHLTATYSRTLAGRLSEAITPMLDRPR